MRHFYIRASVHKDDVHPWQGKVTYGPDGYARVPIGCVALEYNDDIIVNGPKNALNMAFTFISPEDNFGYHTANQIARGRIKAKKYKVVHYDNFVNTIEKNKAHEIFKEMDFHHKYLKFIHPDLFAVSARACLKKLALDKLDSEKHKVHAHD